jgi:hypothetical protein
MAAANDDISTEYYTQAGHLLPTYQPTKDTTKQHMWPTNTCTTPTGYDAIGDDTINIRPAMRIHQRSEHIENIDKTMKKSVKSHTSNTEVELDKAGKKAMRTHGNKETWHARYITSTLDSIYDFTDAAALDASLRPETDTLPRSTAIGIWTGPEPRNTDIPNPQQDETEEDLLIRRGKGLTGLPTPSPVIHTAHAVTHTPHAYRDVPIISYLDNNY